MADLTMPQRQTYPAVKGRAADQVGPLPLDQADQVDLLVEPVGGGALITLAATVLDPALPASEFEDADGNTVGANWEAPIGGGMSDTVVSLRGKLKITWDSASTPPRVQYVPKTGFIEIDITENVTES